MAITSCEKSKRRLDLEFSLYLVICLALFSFTAFVGTAILAKDERIKSSVTEEQRSSALFSEFKEKIPDNLSLSHRSLIINQAKKLRDGLLQVEKINVTHNNELIFVAALFSIFVLVLFLFISSWVQLRVFDPISELIDISVRKDALTHLSTFKTSSLDIEILRCLFADLVLHRVEKEKQEKHFFSLEKQAAVAKIAAQVAHDIRSPLAALSVLEKDLATLREDKRVMVRCAVNRIRDISNNLLDKRIIDPNFDKLLPERHSPQLIIALLEQLITEKRIQYREKLDIEINDQFDLNSYGLFANVQPIELKRVVSNLVNNAVEALPNVGCVLLGLSLHHGDIQITVSDNGRGISEEILPRLMRSGETYGKINGSGLGLYHASQTVRLWGGDINIASTVDEGSIVTMTLPKSEAPAWFVKKIIIRSAMTIIIVDDDASIHQVWQTRMAVICENIPGIRVLHFSMPAEFEIFLKEKSSLDLNVLYLIDYEYLGSTDNGLDLIENNGIAIHSILVTSRFEEPLIRARCGNLGVKLIPKALAGFVPIEIVEQKLEIDCFG